MWSLEIVQLILELLVAGTLPSSINSAIFAFVQNIATYIVIKEIPLIWFIRKFRTVLLIKCQILAAYCISKLEKWGTIQTDGTGHQKTAIINLIIKITQSNEPIFLPVLLSASVIPEYETTVVQYDVIVLFIENKKKWLQKWKDLMNTEYPNFECDIKPDGSNHAKLADGGNVMIDGCNLAQKTNM